MADEHGEPADALVLRDLAWVKDLARRLLGDADLAADVAHDAWLIARTQPPAQLEGGVRAWLATVVHHGVQRLRRSERRRRARESAVAAAAATQSPADVVERGVLARELTTAVMELDEPFRSAILLRYLDGLSTAEVAVRQQVSAVAARKRLSRALQSLRERLERTHAGGFAAWGIAWRHEFGLAPAPVAGAAGAGLWIMNGKLMSTAVAALAAMFLGWQVWPRSASPQPSPVDREPSVAATVGDDRAAGAGPAASRAPAEPMRTLEVVDAAGVPQPHVPVFVLAGGGLLQSARTDATGRAELTAPAADEVLVAAHGAVPQRVRLETITARQRVVLATGAVVEGVVQLPPLPHEAVVLHLEHDRAAAWARGLDEGVLAELARSGIGERRLRLEPAADGAFRFTGLAPDWTGALTTDGAWTLREPSGRGCLDDACTLLLLQPVQGLRLELTPPFVIRGRLLAGDGPAAGLTVSVVAPEPAGAGTFRSGISDADGRFRIGVPRPARGGAWRGELLVGSAGDHLLQRRLEATATESTVDLGDLGVGRSLVFVVRGTDGAPLAGAEARVVTADGAFVTATTDAQGRAVLFGVPPQAREGQVVAHGHRLTLVPLPAGGEVAVRLVAGNGVDLQVVEPDGGPATGLRVRLEAECLPFAAPGQTTPMPGPFVQAFPLDDQGRWQFADLFPGVLLRLVVVDELGQEVGRTDVVAPPLGRCDAVTITVAARTFHCEGRVQDEQGRAVPRVRLHAEHGGQALTARSDAEGRFRLGPLRAPLAGVHLEADHPAFVTWLQTDAVLQPGTPLDLVLARGRTLRVSARQRGGAPVVARDVWLTFEGAPVCLGRAGDDGHWVFERAAARPGRLVVRLGGRECSEPIDALATDLDVRLPDLGTVTVSFAPIGPLARGERLCLVLAPVDPAGEVDRSYLPADTEPTTAAPVLQLLPGRYSLALEARRLGGGGARVRQLGTAHELTITAGSSVQVVLP